MRSSGPLSVAIIGLGPRGLSVLERLILRLRARGGTPVTIWAVDPVEHGSGRVWRSGQPEWLAANATAGELTAHSPDNPLLPGDEPYSLAEWSANQLAPDEYPSRARYGTYLHEFFQRLCRLAPEGVCVRPILGRAIGLFRAAQGLRLRIDDGGPDLHVDKAVLTTGHSALEPDETELAFRRHADRHGLRCLGPGIAAELPLDEIPAGGTVAVRGLGLTFYDVVRSLTTGRGGRFERDADRTLRYHASGREPHIVAGSRSGLPFLARAQVHRPELAPNPVLLTEERVAALRARATAERGSPKLDFAAEVEPLLWAEVEHAYYRCTLRLRDGHGAVEAFTEAFGATADDAGELDPRRKGKVLAAFGLGDVPPLRPELLARPFAGRTFGSPVEFRAELRRLLAEDVETSKLGPEGSPVKAALEMMRTLRPALPGIVDFGGLLPKSQEDFLTRFAPANFLLSAGPPVEHVEQLVSLVDAGLVEVAGPRAQFSCGDGCFAVESPDVAGSRREARVLLDARAPAPDLSRDRDPLLRQLLADGMISEYVNVDPATGERFATGGLAVTDSPFHVLDARGEADPDLYALGVVTQNTRWFTQVGTGRPGQDSPFRRDADAIAQDVLGEAA
ncbi:FAD/NAD(P)-binding protein [Amycolatopsis sacchari]|uniref:Methylaspartate mutase epsilon subunit n=1 Tax=Amycolatopsis sacchari TaxID=115433 RepID=A0A1I3VRA5_9PSEU|nr:FAD/NAD(P)-binding protein [Amycolatopsis sacchari]SFJ97775.1 methylaspartate mutase epsilon subunit [Amycolatopsis sacchari]